jgi:hypothetical protein
MVLLNDRFVRDVARDFALLLSRSQINESDLSDIASQRIIEEAFETLFARLPTQTELQASQEFLAAQMQSRTLRGKEGSEAEPKEIHIESLTDLCQALFGLNEFVYID